MTPDGEQAFMFLCGLIRVRATFEVPKFWNSRRGSAGRVLTGVRQHLAAFLLTHCCCERCRSWQSFEVTNTAAVPRGPSPNRSTPELPRLQRAIIVSKYQIDTSTVWPVVSSRSS